MTFRMTHKNINPKVSGSQGPKLLNHFTPLKTLSIRAWLWSSSYSFELLFLKYVIFKPRNDDWFISAFLCYVFLQSNESDLEIQNSQTSTIFAVDLDRKWWFKSPLQLFWSRLWQLCSIFVFISSISCRRIFGNSDIIPVSKIFCFGHIPELLTSIFAKKFWMQ